MLSENGSAYGAFESESNAKISAYKLQNHQPFQKSDTAEPPMTKSGAAAGTQLKGLLCTDRNKDGSGLLMKPVQEEESGYMTNYTLNTILNAEAFSNLGH